MKSGTADRVAVCCSRIFVRELETRIPFRYGITEMRRVPHLILRVGVEIGGRLWEGFAADHLPPKWFTKNLESTFEADRDEMVRSVTQGCWIAERIGEVETVFDLWRSVYEAQHEWARQKGMEALLAGFGISLLERACIDAVCRARQMPFGIALRTGRLGLRLGDVHQELAGKEVEEFLPPRSQAQVRVRHTVGMGDPLDECDVASGSFPQDGLPVSLEECIRSYGLSFFKVKLGACTERNLKRLRDIGTVLRKTGGQRGVEGITLDGNESYRSVSDFRDFWEVLKREGDLEPLLSRVLFVEQPLSRSMALREETGRELRGWRDRPPMIIDESDAEVGDLPRALDCGYSGVSHKNCKGVFRSVGNAALLEQRRRQDPGGGWIQSAEDLCNVGPLALMQDLAVVAALGIAHVERNGHYYIRGLSQFPHAIQTQVLRLHPDLYEMHQGQYPVLRIRGGALCLPSVVEAPFGSPLAFGDDLLSEFAGGESEVAPV
jgi:hypothetical protein